MNLVLFVLLLVLKQAFACGSGYTSRGGSGDSVRQSRSALRPSTALALLNGKSPCANSGCSSCHSVNFSPISRTYGSMTLTAHPAFIALMDKVFGDMQRENPSLLSRIRTAGALCCRKVKRASGGCGSSLSNHAYGFAVDLQIGTLDRHGDGCVDVDLFPVHTFMARYGLFWGKDFRTEDSMHWEVSEQLAQQWLSSGLPSGSGGVMTVPDAPPANTGGGNTGGSTKEGVGTSCSSGGICQDIDIPNQCSTAHLVGKCSGPSSVRCCTNPIGSGDNNGGSGDNNGGGGDNGFGGGDNPFGDLFGDLFNKPSAPTPLPSPAFLPQAPTPVDNQPTNDQEPLAPLTCVAHNQYGECIVKEKCFAPFQVYGACSGRSFATICCAPPKPADLKPATLPPTPMPTPFILDDGQDEPPPVTRLKCFVPAGEGLCVYPNECPPQFYNYQGDASTEGQCVDALSPGLICCAPAPPPNPCAEITFPVSATSVSEVSANFGANIDGSHCHTAVDVYTKGDGVVVAMSAGTVIKVLKNAAKCNDKPVDNIYVYHNSGLLAGRTLVYGHIDPASYVASEGSALERGVPLARTMSCGMLHFELYDGRATKSETWESTRCSPGSVVEKPLLLVDPSPLLQCTVAQDTNFRHNIKLGDMIHDQTPFTRDLQVENTAQPSDSNTGLVITIVAAIAIFLCVTIIALAACFYFQASKKLAADVYDMPAHDPHFVSAREQSSVMMSANAGSAHFASMRERADTGALSVRRGTTLQPGFVYGRASDGTPVAGTYGSYQCEICGKSYNYAEDVESHQKLRHPNDASPFF